MNEQNTVSLGLQKVPCHSLSLKAANIGSGTTPWRFKSQSLAAAGSKSGGQRRKSAESRGETAGLLRSPWPFFLLAASIAREMRLMCVSPEPVCVIP